MIYLAMALFVATIPAANFMLTNVGYCSDVGPCVLPVGFGLMAPSGVYVIGLALVVRDYIHERAGVMAAYGAIVAGALVSWPMTGDRLALAGAFAFFLGESADLLVYEPLRRRGLALAMMASGVVGAIVDSALFLIFAFGSLDFLAGQVVGKLAATVAVVIGLTALRARRA